MPDFLQSGPVLTLPLLRDDTARLERDLVEWTHLRPLALLLPCHIRDAQSDAFALILRTVARLPWVAKVIIGLDGADDAQAEALLPLLAELPMERHLLRLRRPAGKGANLRACADALLHDDRCFAAVMHDCDIRSYSPGFLARLCWPVLHPSAGLLACKGWYARTAGGLHGRLFRLLFQPLLRACRDVLPPHPWLDFLTALRYPLSGELCVRTALLRGLEFSDGWGVEIHLLRGIFEKTEPGEFCQAELCTAYDHKHQAAADLTRMAGEVVLAFMRSLRESGVPPVPAAALLTALQKHAAAAVRESALLADMNSLPQDHGAALMLAAQFVAAAERALAGI